MNSPNAWSTTPRRSRLIFLFGVFFVFATIGLTNDVMAMGRQPEIKFALSVLVSGLFAVGYAVSGITMRSRSWKVSVPLFLVQFLVMTWLGNRFPGERQLTQLSAAETTGLRSRLTFDGLAMITSVVLGYVGFVYVFVAEGKRYVRTQVEKASLESEMAAAHEVQRLMIPEKLPSIEGFTFESVYYPAMEVGGDFFQIIPLKGGGTLVVIGDVSGKGLGAAMVVSMMVGTLRTISGISEAPEEILRALNRILLESTYEGFATCVAIRLETGGKFLMANAGHLSPYINGVEVPFGGSTPLGLIEDATYEQVSLQLSAGDVAVLLTDGIAEAQDEDRHLLGFSGIESLLREGASATGLADAARRHGQTDDISITCDR